MRSITVKKKKVAASSLNESISWNRVGAAEILQNLLPVPDTIAPPPPVAPLHLPTNNAPSIPSTLSASPSSSPSAETSFSFASSSSSVSLPSAMISQLASSSAPIHPQSPPLSSAPPPSSSTSSASSSSSSVPIASSVSSDEEEARKNASPKPPSATASVTKAEVASSSPPGPIPVEPAAATAAVSLIKPDSTAATKNARKNNWVSTTMNHEVACDMVLYFLSVSVSIKERRWMFQTTKKAFIGSEAVDALVSVCEGIYNRSDIARVGQVLLDEGLFEAISSQEERFIDEYEFYSFVSEPNAVIQALQPVNVLKGVMTILTALQVMPLPDVAIKGDSVTPITEDAPLELTTPTEAPSSSSSSSSSSGGTKGNLKKRFKTSSSATNLLFKVSQSPITPRSKVPEVPLSAMSSVSTTNATTPLSPTENKTQIISSTPRNQDIEQTEITFVNNPANPAYPLIKSATIQKLIERLTNEKSPDIRFRDAFLIYYSAFLPHEKLLEHLIERWKTQIPSSIDNAAHINAWIANVQTPVRLRVMNVIRRWIEIHPCVFTENKELRQATRDFINEISQKNDATNSTHILSLLDSCLPEVLTSDQQALVHQYQRHQVTLLLRNEVPKDRSTVLVWNFLDDEFQVEETARHLAIIDHHLISKIQITEFVGQKWTKKNKNEIAPNIMNSIKYFNTISHWVASTILSQLRVEQRTTCLTKFIDLIQKLMQLHDFYGAMAVIAGVDSIAVRKLKKTWRRLEVEKYDIIAEVKEFFAYDGNYKIYRKALSVVQPPCVPYLGMYLTDLTFIEDASPDFVSDQLVNFFKFNKCAQVVSDLLEFQRTPYQFEIDPTLLLRMYHLPTLEEQEVFNLASRLEPANPEEAVENMVVEGAQLRLELERTRKQLSETQYLQQHSQSLLSLLIDENSNLRTVLRSLNISYPANAALSQLLADPLTVNCLPSSAPAFSPSIILKDSPSAVPLAFVVPSSAPASVIRSTLDGSPTSGPSLASPPPERSARTLTNEETKVPLAASIPLQPEGAEAMHRKPSMILSPPSPSMVPSVSAPSSRSPSFSSSSPPEELLLEIGTEVDRAVSKSAAEPIPSKTITPRTGTGAASGSSPSTSASSSSSCSPSSCSPSSSMPFTLSTSPGGVPAESGHYVTTNPSMASALGRTRSPTIGWKRAFVSPEEVPDLSDLSDLPES